MGNFSPSRTSILGANEITGVTVSDGTKSGPGLTSTLNSSLPVINIVKLNNVITTTIQIALKGLTSKNDVDDVIGLASGGAARICKITTEVPPIKHAHTMPT